MPLSTSSAAMTPSEMIVSLDARSLSLAIKERRVTCEQVMEATLDRIEAVNPLCNAILLLRDREELLAEARTADDRPDEQRGWLHGIPMAIKDISNAKGIPTTMGGSKLSQNFVPSISDFFVSNLSKEGAILIGKTNTPENGLGSHTFNERWGATLNPWDCSKSAGGSSGGAAAAVASRMLVCADGTDMMGSLRNPAGWNNLYSHRPTAGIIRGPLASPKNPLPYPTSTAGPIAKTPIDCAYLLETMAGAKEFQASSVVDTQVSLDGLRIGWLENWGGALPMEDGVVQLCRKALQEGFEAHGATMTTIPPDDVFPLSQLWTSWNNVRFGTVAHKFSQFMDVSILLGDQSPVKAELQWEIEQGLGVTDQDLENAGKARDEYEAWLERVLESYDVLALPSAQVFPFPQEWKWPQSIGETPMDTYHRWMQVAIPVTFGGLPCTTIPAGFGDAGLPMGIQIFARRGEDGKTLAIANAYHQVVDWVSQAELLSPTSIQTGERILQ